MAPTTSDTPGDGRRPPAADDEYSIERRTVQGHEALIARHPDRVAVEWRTGHPRYFGVRVGDRLKDADADVSSPRITEWEVTEITPELVVGEAVKSGEKREFERARVEQGLMIGNYATNLTGFERCVVHAVGSWEEYDPDATGDDVVYRGNPYVTLVVYGNNGQTYGLRYRYTEPNAETVTLWEEDVAVGALETELHEELTRTVEAALRDEGYTVV